LHVEPTPDSTRLLVHTGSSAVGRLRLWVPEAVTSNTGVSAVYPVGAWVRRGHALEQTVSGDAIVGPGNFTRLDEKTFESCGARIPADQPVEWTTRVFPDEAGLRFFIRLRNLGHLCLRKAGAAVCVRFLDGAWWSAEQTVVCSGGRLISLAALDAYEAGSKETRAYLLKGQSYDNLLYRQLWGLSQSTVDRAVIVSQNAGAGVCVGVESEAAYILLNNRKGPCTDMLLAFGDVEPGAEAEAGGKVWLRAGLAQEVLGEAS